MTDTTKDRLQSNCESIANDITNGIEVTEDNVDYYPNLGIGDTVSAYDYLQDMLDINYTINADMSYKSCRVCVGFGGPSLYINTSNNMVEGYWWGTTVKVPFTDSMDIDDMAEELYEIRRGESYD